MEGIFDYYTSKIRHEEQEGATQEKIKEAKIPENLTEKEKKAACQAALHAKIRFEYTGYYF